MSVLSDLSDRGLTREQAVVLLNERGVTIEKGDRAGEPVTVADMNRKIRTGAIPRSWRNALGIEASPGAAEPPGEEAAAREPGHGSATRGRAHELPPQRPKDAKVQPLALPEGSGKRIAGLYRGGGSLLAMQVRRTHGENAGQGVARVFSDQADPIAQLWLQAAEENPAIARFVNTINGGGVTGDLVLAHVVLAASLIYILGAPLPDAAFSKYARYRVVVEPQPRAEPPVDPTEPRFDGGPNGASASAVGSTPV